MKPFDLEKALSGDPLVTRCGHKVTDIKHYPGATQDAFCLTALVHGHTVEVETFKKSGQFTAGENGFDLFMADNEKWVNVYYNKEKDLAFCSETYESEIEARTGSLPTHYITTIQVRK
jgi:hypothetical protein